MSRSAFAEALKESQAPPQDRAAVLHEYDDLPPPYRLMPDAAATTDVTFLTRDRRRDTEGDKPYFIHPVRVASQGLEIRKRLPQELSEADRSLMLAIDLSHDTPEERTRFAMERLEADVRKDTASRIRHRGATGSAFRKRLDLLVDDHIATELPTVRKENIYRTVSGLVESVEGIDFNPTQLYGVHDFLGLLLDIFEVITPGAPSRDIIANSTAFMLSRAARHQNKLVGLLSFDLKERDRIDNRSTLIVQVDDMLELFDPQWQRGAMQRQNYHIDDSKEYRHEHHRNVQRRLRAYQAIERAGRDNRSLASRILEYQKGQLTINEHIKFLAKLNGQQTKYAALADSGEHSLYASALSLEDWTSRELNYLVLCESISRSAARSLPARKTAISKYLLTPESQVFQTTHDEGSDNPDGSLGALTAAEIRTAKGFREQLDKPQFALPYVLLLQRIAERVVNDLESIRGFDRDTQTRKRKPSGPIENVFHVKGDILYFMRGAVRDYERRAEE